ncbi:aromatic acid exporter family protein [Ammoniphilus sp. CFH 90114]|uniref:aromatic acid exporter family protein n=1 Tax=Ammoniphilus sp. CFH 90114 TaxID=2493665 RepID=UPI00100E236C|nr:aromatic acid exporter family protein [Ammoniphilus sp. CFH 90114]RXT06250.1 aromatic acid exporter family protein [Ammoniphilus sp. CFH 90114]
MFGIGFRTIKTALGTGISLFLAQSLGLQYFVSAGILTILCIQPTKKRSITTAMARAVACLIGLGSGALVFSILGYHWLSVMLLFLLHIPLLVRLKIQEGIVTSAVIIFHLYLDQQFTLSLLWNEVQLIAIGVGIALLMNLYMPSHEKKLKHFQEEIDQNIQIILKELAAFIRAGDTLWSGKEFVDTANRLEEAKDLSLQTVENQLLRKQDQHYRYFKMRERQFERLERMLPVVSSIDVQVPQCHFVGELFEYLGQHLHDNPRDTLQHLQRVRGFLKGLELPLTREEFEARASLFTILNELEQFILIQLELA